MRTPESGLGLTEVLVSIAVLALAMTTALVLYDDARRSFRLNENVIDQQQVVRIAFDMMSADLRRAGLNTNPDGDENRPDEQIEAAYATAIVIRADLDGETPAARIPEAALELAGIFDAVSTGNDEIVGYALGNPARSTTLTYHADVGGQTRDGLVEPVSIPNIALVHDDPPFTLYRITLAANAAVVKTPLADNLRSLRFTYYDQAGNVVAPVGGGESLAHVRTRQTIRRVVVEIEGLTRDADRNWLDAADPHPYSRHRRKFSLAGDITPRNLGMKGLLDLDAELRLPPPNTLPVLVPGHCEGLYVKWSVPPRDQWAYLVRYQDSMGLTGEVTAAGNGTYVSGLADGRQHTATLSYVDPFGNVSDPTSPGTATTSNIAAPAAPQNLAATDDLNGSIRVTWNAVIANDAPIPGDPQTPLLRDLRRYLLQRRPAGSATWASRWWSGAGAPSYNETDVVPCVDYEFRVRGQDWCESNGPWSSLTEGIALSDVDPLAPSNIEAYFLNGNTQVRVRWQEVVHNVDLDPVQVNYEIYRVYWSGADAPADLGLYQKVAEVPGNSVPLQYIDAALSIPPSQKVFYRVVAVDDCENASLPSEAVEPAACQFTGEVVVVTPDWGADTSGSNTVQVDVVGGAELYTKLRLEFVNLDTQMTNPVIECPLPGPCQETSGSGRKSWQVQWTNGVARPHRIEARVTTADACSVTRTILVGPGL